MHELVQDFRYGFRILRNEPATTAIAIVALSLGIGANSAIFSVMNAVLLRPLPYLDSSRIVVLYEDKLDKGMRKQLISPLDYKNYAQQTETLDEIGAVLDQPFALTGRDLPERIEGAAVSPGVFQILGMRPSLGRAFAPDEDRPDKNAEVVLSDGLWRRRFASDPKILGSSLVLNGKSYAVVGVASPGFRLVDSPSELWIPYTPDTADLVPVRQGFHSLRVLGHLKPGVSLRQAEQDMNAIAVRISQANPNIHAGYSAELTPLREQMVGDLGATLWPLTGAVAFVLLIACTNVANLLLARAGGREKEMAVRGSLGATPGRILRQLLSESVLLAVLGGMGGLALAWFGVKAIVKLAAPSIPQVGTISLDWRVLAFTLGVSLFTGILFGLAPALSILRLDLNSVLRGSGRSNMGNVRASRLRNTLVVFEIACCIVLLSSAGLLIRSFANLQRVSPGFRTDHVLTMQLALPPNQYSGLRLGHFYQQFLDRVQVLPGVESAGLCRFLPLSGTDVSLNFQIEGQPMLATADQPRAKFRAASPGYFAALGIPLLRGAVFSASEGEQTRKVVVINEAAAKRYWPGRDPIGTRILSGTDRNVWSTIIGVVGNVKHAGLDAETSPETYFHYLQIPADVINFAESTMFLAVRSNQEPSALTPAVRSALRDVDPNQPVFNVRTMQDVVLNSIAQPRFRMWLLAAFAFLALVLAAVGMYGVISYSMTQRVNELGIRMALGAQRADICKMVVGHGFKMAVAGMVAGLLIASGSTWILSRLLFGVSAIDIPTFAATCLLTTVVAVAASLFPALRAIRIDPAVALRSE